MLFSFIDAMTRLNSYTKRVKPCAFHKFLNRIWNLYKLCLLLQQAYHLLGRQGYQALLLASLIVLGIFNNPLVSLIFSSKVECDPSIITDFIPNFNDSSLVSNVHEGLNAKQSGYHFP